MRRWFSPYWFNDVSIMFLDVGAVLLVVGVLLRHPPADPQFVPVFFLAGICGLVTGYNVVRRRHAVARFKRIFGFMPGSVRHDERFRHLVENEIRSRAEVLRTAYGERDASRDARRRAANATAAHSLQRDYELADMVADINYRRFYEAIDAATSKRLPAPYSKISREYAEWVSGRVPTHSF